MVITDLLQFRVRKEQRVYNVVKNVILLPALAKPVANASHNTRPTSGLNQTIGHLQTKKIRGTAKWNIDF